MEVKHRYRLNCSFKFNISDFPKEFDIQLIELFGWYSASNRGNNVNGISRDHMLSVHDGFKNNISSEIIAHPANCRLMRHNENQKKNVSSSISLEELNIMIEGWNNKYKHS